MPCQPLGSGINNSWEQGWSSQVLRGLWTCWGAHPLPLGWHVPVPPLPISLLQSYDTELYTLLYFIFLLSILYLLHLKLTVSFTCCLRTDNLCLLLPYLCLVLDFTNNFSVLLPSDLSRYLWNSPSGVSTWDIREKDLWWENQHKLWVSSAESQLTSQTLSCSVLQAMEFLSWLQHRQCCSSTGRSITPWSLMGEVEDPLSVALWPLSLEPQVSWDDTLSTA